MTTIVGGRGVLPMRFAAPYRTLAIFLLLLFATLSATAAEQRIALVIGNSKYASAPLRNPVNDATAMAKKLREMGFEVILRSDVSQREMTRAISEFGQKLAHSRGVALFYYAGHGMQARGKNYLVPVDAEVTTEGSVSTESIDVERVLDQLTPARLSMVILDACRNNPFERRFRSGAGSGLAQIDAPAGTLIAYATAPGKVAQDGEGAHGTYTDALLRAIETPGLRVEDVFKQVRIRVIKATASQQIPWESSSLTGDFLFRPAEAGQQAAAKVDDEALAVREQLASLSAEISKLRESQPASGSSPAQNAQERKKVDQEAAAARDQLALINAEIAALRAGSLVSRAPTAEELAAWKKQIAKVEATRGKLTLTSAIATLFDTPDGGDAVRIQAFEKEVAKRPYNSALAFGVDASGFIVWGGSHSQYSRFQAIEVARDFCTASGGSTCKVVYVNRSFAEDSWLEVIKQLGNQPVEAVRNAFISSLRQPITQNMTASATLHNNYRAGFGYTFSRTASK